jgi:hypothetical protein
VSILVALNHIMHYRHDRLVKLDPQIVRLRPAPFLCAKPGARQSICRGSALPRVAAVVRSASDNWYSLTAQIRYS